MVGATDIGREPVQIVEILQPFCVNTYGTAPCTAAEGADFKCYNTRATCGDTANFRIKPEGSLGAASFTKNDGDIILASEVTRTADIFAAVDVTFPSSIAPGIIWEQGGATNALYLGVTSGNRYTLYFKASALP